MNLKIEAFSVGRVGHRRHGVIINSESQVLGAATISSREINKYPGTAEVMLHYSADQVEKRPSDLHRDPCFVLDREGVCEGVSMPGLKHRPISEVQAELAIRLLTGSRISDRL